MGGLAQIAQSQVVWEHQVSQNDSLKRVDDEARSISVPLGISLGNIASSKRQKSVIP